MDRGTVTAGAYEGLTGRLDRSAGGCSGATAGRTGASALGPARIDPVLPWTAPPTRADFAGEEPLEEQQVILHQVWAQLPEPERQRFGHCFSFMVLKALGLRPRPIREVEA